MGDAPTLGSLPTVLTAIWDTLTNATTGLIPKISSTPLLLIGVAFTFAFGAVRLAKRLMGVRR